MQAPRRPVATGLRSVVGLGSSLLALVLLHAAASSPAAGAGAWASPGRRPDEVLAVVLAWAGMALAGWLGLGSVLALLSTLPGTLGRCCGRLADHLTPLLVRKVLTVALGTSTVSLTLPPAGVVGTTAAPSPVGAAHPTGPGRPLALTAQTVLPDRSPSGRGAADLPRTSTGPGPGFGSTVDVGPGYRPTRDPARRSPATDSRGATPGFRPTRPAPAHDGTGAGLLSPAPRPGVAALDTVTVRRGDSLWSIAERHLGASASSAEVARAWPRWYAANRAVIGDDPGLIRPGMQLVPPREGDPR